MNTAQTEAPAKEETFIMVKTDEGYRVCSPLTPAKQYIVTGLPDSPHCTCPDYAKREGDQGGTCRHIGAVLGEMGLIPHSRVNGTPVTNGDNGSAEPPARKTRKSSNSHNNGSGGASMLLKRSVSPDGRIDSLSVEFSCPVSSVTTAEIKQQAASILALQAEITSGFLKTNGSNGKSSGNGALNAVPGQLLAVASMNGKWGLRLFLNILVNGKVMKFFGTKEQLAEAVTSAGYASVAEHLVDGYALNLPCRVVTKPSQDGKYTNVERVLPAQETAPVKG